MIDNYKAIIFDWDGTLVDTCGLILDAHNHVRAHYGHALWTMKDFLGRASQSAREYYPTVYGDKADEAQTILYDYVEAHHLTYIKPMEAVLQLFNYIDNTQKPMAIVSNKRHKTLEIEMDHMGWRDRFETVLGAGQADKDKPAPDPLLMALGQMPSKPKMSEILYVGDTETDLLCAKNSGCDVAFVQSDGPRPDLIEKYAPKYHCHSLLELIEHFKGVKQVA